MIYNNAITNGSASVTGKYMYQMVDAYYLDMLPLAHLNLLDIFDSIKNIPYRDDNKDSEVLVRPALLYAGTGISGDCDDKAIALASWAKIRGIPYRFISVRAFDQKNLHHVFPQLYINDRWLTFDATYSFNPFGRDRKPFGEYVVLDR
jgi:transglutaminase-like putative cysteine protease